MHEVSLNRLITDYLSGEEIMDTTYEDLRQALARMLVEDKKYPRECVRAKYEIPYVVNGEPQVGVLDLAVFSPTGDPLLALRFCPGEVGTFVRESVAVSRIHLPQPFPLIAVTDSMELQMVAAHYGETIAHGFYSIPIWKDLADVAAEYTFAPLSPERLDKERRILMAYDGLGGPCCGGECAV